jgi:Ser/Thr protein kinase RdoA (MazF antagonist)
MEHDEAVRSSLSAWSLPGMPLMERIAGGINSRTWRVEAAGERFVAKLAWDTIAFLAGLEIAEYLESSGLRTGGPIRTRAGDLGVSVGPQQLALLRFVEGRPVDTSCASGLRVWGETMGQAHSLLLTISRVPSGLRRWPWAWLDPAAEHLVHQDWVRSALMQTLAEVPDLEVTRQFTYGVLHGDGAPVRVAANGEPSVIDWGAAMWGPLLYDVASACWFFQYMLVLPI